MNKNGQRQLQATPPSPGCNQLRLSTTTESAVPDHRWEAQKARKAHLLAEARGTKLLPAYRRFLLGDRETRPLRKENQNIMDQTERLITGYTTCTLGYYRQHYMAHLLP